MNDRRQTLKTIVSCALFTSAGAFVSACSRRFHGIDITGANYASDFHLTDFDAQPRALSDFKGKVVVLFFGYVHCPDVCPTTLSDLRLLKEKLGADGDKLQVLFVSVDPERDTPEVLKTYMTVFDSSFLGLYAGSADKLAALAREFKIYYKKVEGKTPASYTVDHTASSYIYDPQGRLRLSSRYGTPVDEVLEDVKRLLAGD
ncbi:MAG: SCO family protein [Burkholderiaceae bacterium]|jgi:protein SCO1/2|nr:SCO family protein [Burkholderiaceae bacterium]